MARKRIAAIIYQTPSAIAANLRKVALVLAGVASPADSKDMAVRAYQPGDTLRANDDVVGAVLYEVGDIIPANMIRLAVKAEVYDSFNRANSNSTLGNTETGQAWSVIDGTWGIDGNQGYLVTSAGGDSRVVVDSGLSDIVVECVITCGVGIAGLLVRWQSATNNVRAWINASGTLTLTKTVDGVNTDVATMELTWTAGDVLRAVCVGSNINIYQNSTLRITAVVSELTTMTMQGMVVAGASATVPRFNNFQVMSDVDVE